MAKKIIPGLIILFWLFMMFQLLWNRIIPKYFLHSPPPYQDIKAEGLKPYVRQMLIYMNDRAMGQTITTFISDEDGAMHIANKTRFKHKSIFLPTALTVDIHLNQQGHLDKFQATIEHKASIGGVIEIRGHAEDNKLIIDDPPGIDPLPFDNRIPLDSPFSTTLRMKGLRIGQRWRMAVINPFKTGSSVEYAFAHVKDIKKIETPEGLVEAHLVEVTIGDYELNKLKLWIDKDGDLVRQELPFNIVLVREKPNDKN